MQQFRLQVDTSYHVTVECMSENTRAGTRFKVCETENEPYVCTLEDVDPKVSISLWLKRGTSFEKAESIAAYLNDHIARVGVTHIK